MDPKDGLAIYASTLNDRGKMKEIGAYIFGDGKITVTFEIKGDELITHDPIYEGDVKPRT